MRVGFILKSLKSRGSSMIRGLIFFVFCFLPLSLIPGLDFYSSQNIPGLDNAFIDRLVDDMDDTELLGQVIMLGFFGSSPSEEILGWIKDRHIGGVKIFGWNAVDLNALVQGIGRMQSAAVSNRQKIPLFIATDQEGGWVRHIRGNTSITPGNMAIGASNLPYDAYLTGFYLGMELRTLGINMNFAPTVDVYLNSDAHVIGPRSFSDDPVATGTLGVAFYKGMEKSGVISTAKHFPGHGNANEDSHGTLPIIECSFDDLWDRDLLPYRFLFRRDLPAIMSAHLAFPNIIGDNTPASLSPFFMTELLRDQMGFEGMIITDDMRMRGASGTGLSTAEASLQALKAGNDMIMISPERNLHERVWNLLYRELRNNPDFRNRIRESARRILKVKVRYLRIEDPVPLFPDPADTALLIPHPQGKDFFTSQAFRGVSVVRNGTLPYIPEPGEKVLLAGQVRQFLSIGSEFYPEADQYFFSYTPFEPVSRADYARIEEVKAELNREAQKYDTVIYCLANPSGNLVMEALKDVPANVIVLSVLTPVYLRYSPWVQTAVAVYGLGRESILAGFAALSGLYQPSGSNPIRMEQSAP